MTDSENPAGLFRSCLKKAGSGDIESILIAAACYIEGCGVSKNEKKGLTFSKKPQKEATLPLSMRSVFRIITDFQEKGT